MYQILKVMKEKIKESIIGQFYLYFKGLYLKRLYLARNKKFIEVLKKYITSDITIISTNCFAGRIMQDLKMQYNSPTLGLYFMYPDYIDFLSNIKHYLTETKLVFTDKSKYQLGNERLQNAEHKYPMALLDNVIEIHFLHYKTEEEAAQKWYRRIERINWNKLFVIGMDQNGCKEADIYNFEKLPFKNKVFFTHRNIKETNVIIPIKEFACRNEVGNPYTERDIFYKYLVKWLAENFK